MVIIIDTREQNPLNFRNIETEVKKLNAGDYSIAGFENKIAIERKSLADIYGTLGKGNKRFQKELRRAINMDHFEIVVEGSFTEFRDKAFENSHYSKLRSDVALKILFTLKHKYNIHITFCRDRNEAASYIRHTLLSYSSQKESAFKVFSDDVDIEMVKKVQKLKKRLRL